MKKIIVPVILLALAVALFFFLKSGSSSKELDGVRYLSIRAEIDQADMAAFEASDDMALKEKCVKKRDSLWGVLAAMRAFEKIPDAPSAVNSNSGVVPVALPENPNVPVDNSQKSSNPVFVYIIGGLVVLIAILALVFFVLRKRQDAITRQLEKIREENRFKTPKSGFPDDPTYVTRTRVHRSIIDDAKASNENSLPKDVIFEDSKGVVEKPTLRPTAKERITSAMQSLSDTLAELRAPKAAVKHEGAPNKVRAQSRNTMESSAIPKDNPLEVTRFDRERADKEKVLQMNRRGYTTSEIARRMQLPEDQVATVIRVKRETGE
ncbi:MAG: hypothetical protein M0P13_01910 [Fibrobacteraceae bacterium]|nr:hypothetical protein [Fibrobacteraceae bacterium]